MSERVLGQPGNRWVHRGCWLEAREGEEATTQVRRPWVEDREENRVWRKGCTRAQNGLRNRLEMDSIFEKDQNRLQKELDQTVCSPF